METAAIRVEFDGTVLGLSEEAGRLVVTESTAGMSSLPVLAHESGMTPEVRVGGKRSSEDGMFNCPLGVAVNYETGNIYISEVNNDGRVQVFDSNGEYLYKFGDEMNSLKYISLSRNRVFVLQYSSNSVSVYDLYGALITHFRAIVESQLSHPSGIAISEMNGDIYVCDYNNSRIQAYYKELPFKSHFGQGILESPRDIKVTSEFIYVLSFHKPLLYSFTYDFTQIHNTAISSLSKHLKCPHAFCINGSGHFIMSDWGQDAIVIFNQQGELVRTITDGVRCPWGVTQDSKGRILVVSYNHSLLIF